MQQAVIANMHNNSMLLDPETTAALVTLAQRSAVAAVYVLMA